MTTQMRLTTTQRGLGAAHQQRSKRMRKTMADGTPCAICGRPMYRWQILELDHTVPRALGGTNGPTALAHRYCNRRKGAILGNKLRARRRRVVRYTRW